MKSAVLGTLIGVVVAAVAVTTSCSIHHRSDQFSCTTNGDCEGGRVCDNGFCIVPGSIDAPGPPGDGKPPPDSAGCPTGCTSCNTTTKQCTINCTTANCTNTVTCPAGWRCDVMCNTDNACRNGVNCTAATACQVECTGRQSCENVMCGPGPCDVGCSGPDTCRAIVCGSSCACNVVCTGLSSCTQNIFCSSIGCRSGSGCTSVPPLCHTCM